MVVSSGCGSSAATDYLSQVRADPATKDTWVSKRDDDRVIASGKNFCTKGLVLLPFADPAGDNSKAIAAGDAVERAAKKWLCPDGKYIGPEVTAKP